jgi:hypothetical protein
MKRKKRKKILKELKAMEDEMNALFPYIKTEEQIQAAMQLLNEIKQQRFKIKENTGKEWS